MHRHTGGLVDHGQVVVFVDDVKRNVLGLGAQWSGLRLAFDLDLLATAEFVAGLRGRTIHGDLAVLDEHLHARAANVRDCLGEIGIQAHLCGCGLSDEAADAVLWLKVFQNLDFRSGRLERLEAFVARCVRCCGFVAGAGGVGDAPVMLSQIRLMMQTLLRLQTASPGFEAGGVLTASVTLPILKYPNAEQRIAFYKTLRDRLTVLPGVQAASMVSLIPLGGSNTGLNLSIEGQPPPRPDETPIFWRRIVDPGYFRVMRIPLIRGREFSEQDAGSPPAAIISETMARRYWPGADPIGKRFGSANRWYTVVGIVGDVKFTSLTRDPDPEFYEPYRQAPIPEMVLTVRAASDPLRFAMISWTSMHSAGIALPTRRLSCHHHR